MEIKDEWQVIPKAVAWAQGRQDIRAVLITSSRARYGIDLDEFSDYDIVLVAKDIRPYLEDETWLAEFGLVLVLYRDPVSPILGFDKFVRVTQYDNGLKIDFTVWPVGLLKHVAGMTELPDFIDDGYQVLLDKDGLTRGMKAPSGQAFVPKPPTETEYRQFIEGFFSNTPYAAKYIRRGVDYFPLNYMFDYLRHEKMHKLLEWQVQIEHEWSLRSGLYGKGLQKYIDPEIIDEIEKAYVGSGTESGWETLYRVIDLFRKIAVKVGLGLGYAYPEDIDRRVMVYLCKVQTGKLP
jgi:aminoglycoside 6-adenylyltransferase